MTSPLIRGAALLAALVAFGCSNDGGGGPVAGSLDLVLTSPNTDDGAVMLQVIGVVDSVEVPAGLVAYQSVPGSNVIRAIVTGDLRSGGTLLTLHVPDVGKASSYTFVVMQVAAQDTYAQRPVGGYSLSLQ